MHPEVDLLDQIVVMPYDPAWQGDFETEAKRILHALGNIVVSVHHIGSTAIPGIFAKPIIDILLEVDNLVQLDNETGAMQELSYEAMGEFGIPGRRYFRKNNHLGVRTHQVHAFQIRNPEIERHLAFRDYMIAHPMQAQAYGALKRELAREYPNDSQAYMDGKDEFVKEHEAKALSWRRSRC